MSSSEDPSETNPPGLKDPPVPKKKKRDREEQDVVGTLSAKDIPYVKAAVGVTTLSNKYKGNVTAYNKCGGNHVFKITSFAY